ncbi:hypothetical protein TNCV_1721211 [Trichonephila clavipes]|nr:hypothetical protein TNCV_1721211 [Trichonephila clavipes]
MRRTDVKLTRLRIGHTRFTHRHLLLGEDAPECPRRANAALHRQPNAQRPLQAAGERWRPSARGSQVRTVELILIESPTTGVGRLYQGAVYF